MVPNDFLCVLKPGGTNFIKTWDPLQNSSCQNGNMKQVPYLGSKNIMRHRTKFSRHGDLVPGVCAPIVLKRSVTNSDGLL